MDESAARSRETELRALMVAGLSGDSVAHRNLLGRLGGHLRAYYKHRFARLGRGPEEAEDLVQEALIAIHTRRDTYDPSLPFTPWAYAIARYKFLDWLRRTKASLADVPIEDAGALIATDDHAGIDSAHDLGVLMTGISDKSRRAIQYVKLDGMSVREAADRLGMTESAVKVTVHRGLKALAALIGKGART